MTFQGTWRSKDEWFARYERAVNEATSLPKGAFIDRMMALGVDPEEALAIWRAEKTLEPVQKLMDDITGGKDGGR